MERQIIRIGDIISAFALNLRLKFCLARNRRRTASTVNRRVWPHPLRGPFGNRPAALHSTSPETVIVPGQQRIRNTSPNAANGSA